MSGICGGWLFDGDTPDIRPILSKLERRGPDGTHSWADGPVALGHTLLATTPEALVEVLPLTEPNSGCTITADARLDNREELIAALGLLKTRTLGDGELVLRAYLHWGDECPKHLLGDFAFAIWDPRSQQLFCARDHMGMRQLIYHHAPGRMLAFGTEVDAVLACNGVPRRLNEGRIGDFIEDLEGIDLSSTFFEEILRLPPAHTLTVDGNGLSVRCYWQLTPGPELKLDSDQAYAEAFLEVFTEAVRCRLRSAGPIGSMLSGGLDSSSVTSVAARLLAADGAGPLATFSAIGPDPTSCQETKSILAALALPGLDPTTINHANLAPLMPDLIRSTEQVGEPFDGLMTLIRAIYVAAHHDGIRVMLDGVGGDVALIASNRIVAHLRAFRWGRAWREARGAQRFWKFPRYALHQLLSGTWNAFVPLRIRQFRHKWIAKSGVGRRSTKTRMTPSFSAAIDYEARRTIFRANYNHADLPDSERRAHSIRHPNLTVGRERYDREASRLAVEPRDPFLDIRLLQFCLSLPGAQLEEAGWPKVILRRAMAGLIPDSVVWRRGKEHLGWRFTAALFQDWPGWRAELMNASPKMDRYMPADATLDAERDDGPDHPELQFCIEAFILSRWLERNEVGDV